MKAKPFLILFFAVVALLGAVSIYFRATIERADRAVTTFVSPDGKFKAVRLTFSGGGDRPFCVDGISVLLAAYPDHFADKNKAYEVYSAPCATFANGERLPKIEWLSGAALRIVHAARPEAKVLRTKDRDVTRLVHVTFVTRE